MEPGEERVGLAALAGLWHDVGKFAQRAGELGSRLWDSEGQRDFRYYHALLSVDAVEKLVPEPWRGPVGAAVGTHHRPQGDLAGLVQLADHLSAAEREADEEARVPYLRSPFSLLNGQDIPAYLPLAALEPSTEAIYPQMRERESSPDEAMADYQRLWESFVRDARVLAATDLDGMIESSMELLQRYTWAIPSAYYRNVPDVSLYDHARTTGALAACFAADGRDAAWAGRVMEGLRQGGQAADEPVAQLVGGDISGIQDYLYNTGSGGAAKSLRGRSFYLQLLTEVTALAALEALALPLTNLLYVGGGHFYLLAPAGARSAGKLAAFQARLARALLEAHEGQLYLALASLPLAAQRFSPGSFGAAWGEMSGLLKRDKLRRYAALGEGLAREVGVPLNQGGHPEEVCLVCGREGGWQPDEDGDRKCPFCLSLEELGNQLRTASALVLASVPPIAGRVRRWEEGLRALGVDVQVLQPEDTRANVPQGTTRARVWMLRSGSDGPQVNSGAPAVTSRHWLALVAPRVVDDRSGRERIATIEELAEASQTAIKQWGVLRMDVDDLGQLFREGFGERASLSRVAALSFQLRLFFEGHVGALMAPYNRSGVERAGRDTVYVMYTGGDDLFIVGAWEVLPLLARDIRRAFVRFVAGNPRITLSGGIAVRPAKFPLYQAAAEAGRALEGGAKAHRRAQDSTHGKDALAWLGIVVGWEEYEAVQGQVEEWERWVQDGVAPRMVLQLLRRVADEAEQGRGEAYRRGLLRRPGQRLLGPWTWRLVYALSRRREQARRDSRRHPGMEAAYGAYVRRLEGLEQELIWQEGSTRTIGLVARWAEYLCRKESRGQTL